MLISVSNKEKIGHTLHDTIISAKDVNFPSCFIIIFMII